MESKLQYFVRFNKPRCGEYGAFVNELEFVALALKDQIKNECEIVVRDGFVIESNIKSVFDAIINSTDTDVWRQCGGDGDVR